MPLSVNNAYDIGRKHERDRIIELLNTECCELVDCRCSIGIKFAIELIKDDNASE